MAEVKTRPPMRERVLSIKKTAQPVNGGDPAKGTWVKVETFRNPEAFVPSIGVPEGDLDPDKFLLVTKFKPIIVAGRQTGWTGVHTLRERRPR